MAWDITFAELGTFFGNGFIQIFGTPILIGFFLLLVVFWWTRDIQKTMLSMSLLSSVGIIFLSKAGYLPAWMSFIVLVLVASLAGVVVIGLLS